jgi:hypothetical protein
MTKLFCRKILFFILHEIYSAEMPPSKGPLWQFYHTGEKQNSSQYKAHCLACINHHRPADIPLAANHETNATFKDAQWFKDGTKLFHRIEIYCTDVPQLARWQDMFVATRLP